MERPSDIEYDKLKWLLEKLNAAEDFCRPYFERAKRYYRLYRFGTAVDSDDWPYVNRTKTRDILAFVEDSTALLVQTLFAQMPFFAAIPRETSLLMKNFTGIDPNKMGNQIAKALDCQISHEDTEFFEEIVDFFKGGMMMGNSYEGVYPKFVNGQYLRPLLKTTDFWDILPISGARRITRARGVFVREFTNLDDLREAARMGVYKNIDQIKGVESSSGTEVNWHKSLLQEIGMQDYVPDEVDVEVIHYFSGGHVITFADRKVILRDSNEPGRSGYVRKPFPYNMPVVQYKYMPVPLEFFAMGIPEVLEVLQEDKNLIRSARRDNIDLIINKILKAREGAEIDYDEIKYYAGAIWPLERLDDLEEMDMADVTQSSYQEEYGLAKDMENALSLFGYARGMTPQHSEQPTTVMKLQQASLNRLDLAVKLAEFTTLQNIAARIILLTRRYMSQANYEAMIGDKDAGFYRLSEEEIRRFYYFKPVGSSITHIKEIRQAQISTAIESLKSIPPQVRMNNVKPYTVDWYEAEKALLEAVDVHNSDSILIKMPDEDEVARHRQIQNMEGILPLAQKLAQIPYGE